MISAHAIIGPARLTARGFTICSNCNTAVISRGGNTRERPTFASLFVKNARNAFPEHM
jgi:hypothetical protein